MTASAAATAKALQRPHSRPGSCERQAKFIEWIADMFVRAGAQGITLDSLTEFELEWIGRM